MRAPDVLTALCCCQSCTSLDAVGSIRAFAPGASNTEATQDAAGPTAAKLKQARELTAALEAATSRLQAQMADNARLQHLVDEEQLAHDSTKQRRATLEEDVGNKQTELAAALAKLDAAEREAARLRKDQANVSCFYVRVVIILEQFVSAKALSRPLW